MDFNQIKSLFKSSGETMYSPFRDFNIEWYIIIGTATTSSATEELDGEVFNSTIKTKIIKIDKILFIHVFYINLQK